MNGTVRQFTHREWQRLPASPRLWATFAIVVFLFTLTGPFGTLELLGPWARFGYWLALHGLAWGTAIGFSLAADRLLQGRIGSSLGRMAIGSGIASLPIAAEVQLLNGFALAARPEASHFAANLLVTFPLSLLFCLLTYLTLGRDEYGVVADAGAATEGKEMPPSPPPAGAREAVPILKRLRLENRGVLVRLEAEDHYIRVVTRAGSELLLLRFADALAELGGVPGYKVHRSHWVAAAEVREVLRGGSRTSLKMSDGTIVPVSRGQAQALRDALQQLPLAGETGS